MSLDQLLDGLEKATHDKAAPPDSVKERINYLTDEIDKHNYYYHTLDDPKIDDATYDAMWRELQELEKAWPALRKPWSPTLRVGGHLLESLAKKNHATPMYSLDNVFSMGEWYEFLERMGRFFEQTTHDSLPTDFWCDPKLDGLALELVYVDGVFTDALTRGDGMVGEVVTDACRTIATIPLKLKGEKVPPLFTVRGEAVMYKSDFQELNKNQTAKGQRTFANPRNAAAGTLRQLDISVVKSRKLTFLAYNIGKVEWGDEEPVTLHSDLIERLKSYGFLTPPGGILCTDDIAIEHYVQDVRDKRDEYPMEIDGCVIKLNNLNAQSALSFTARAPRFAVAFKFPASQVETKLLKIDIQVGRTGVLTPVAILEPVSVGGVIVQRATLHNADEIAEKDLREGDYVIVQRAGDVIPEIVRPVLKKRGAEVVTFRFPEICPACGSPVFKEVGQAYVRCEYVSCPAVRLRSLIHFVSKSGLDVPGFGEKLMEQLVSKGLVRLPSDLFKLKPKDLLDLDRMGEVLATKLVDALKTAREEATLEKLIAAIGIHHVGQQTARTLADNFEDLAEVGWASVSMLMQLPDVGPEVAQSIQNFFQTPANIAMLEQLYEQGLWPVNKHETDKHVESPLRGKTILFTGTLRIARGLAQKYAEELGAIPVTGVSKKLNYLVVGENPGSKLTKAKALGITTLDEKAFLTLLADQGINPELK